MPTWGECKSTGNVHPYAKFLLKGLGRADATWRLLLPRVGQFVGAAHSDELDLFVSPLNIEATLPSTDMAFKRWWFDFLWGGQLTVTSKDGFFSGVFLGNFPAPDHGWHVFETRPSTKGNVNVNVCFIGEFPKAAIGKLGCWLSSFAASRCFLGVYVSRLTSPENQHNLNVKWISSWNVM